MTSKRRPHWRKYDSRKSLYIYDQGSVMYLSARTRSWVKAEANAREEMDARGTVRKALRRDRRQEDAEEARLASSDRSGDPGRSALPGILRPQQPTSSLSFRPESVIVLGILHTTPALHVPHNRHCIICSGTVRVLCRGTPPSAWKLSPPGNNYDSDSQSFGQQV